MLQKVIFILGIVTASHVLTGCQSSIPASIKNPVTGSPSLQQVREQPQDYLTSQVRWGGIITEHKNRQSTSQLTIVAYPLNRSGRPDISKATEGRFIAEVSGFLEPEVYAKPREITITGTSSEVIDQLVGQYPYRYPMVKAQVHHLWPIKRPSDHNEPRPFWYDPWHDFYYPYHYPFYYPPHWHKPTIPKELIKNHDHH